ncbi:ABC transporter ATP-binding protein [Bacillaceae bacterium S4-13-58]
MKRIWSYAYTYKTALWVGIFLTIIELVVELFQPIIMARMIDEGIQKGDFRLVAIWGTILIGISIFTFFAGIANSFLSSRVGQGAGYDMRKDLFEKVQRFKMKNLQSFDTPTLITRLTNDVTQVQGVIFMFMRVGLRAPLFIIFALIMAFTVHVELAFILLGSVPFIFLFLYWILRKGVTYFQRVQKKLDDVNSIIRENLGGIRLIKGFNRGSHEEERFKQVNYSLLDMNKKALWLMEVAMPIVMLGMNVLILILLWVGAGQLSVGDATAGEVVAILNYATRIMFTFSVFTFLIMNASRGKASIDRIGLVLDEEIETHSSGDRKPILEGAITFKNVSFEYPKSKEPAVNQISFMIDHGKTLGILGETGSGKSSLVHLIPRLYEKSKGEIYIDGHRIDEIDLNYLRHQISLVPQDVHLFSGTVMENICWGKEEATIEEVIQAAKDAQIHSFIESLPDGYDTVIGQRGITFSGGQKQRLSIARALIRRPKILILDDSTSALDAHTEVRLLQTLQDQKCTVLMIAQKVSSVRDADKILLLDHGKLIGEGTHQELLSHNTYYQQIYESQNEKGVI